MIVSPARAMPFWKVVQGYTGISTEYALLAPAGNVSDSGLKYGCLSNSICMCVQAQHESRQHCKINKQKHPTQVIQEFLTACKDLTWKPEQILDEQ